MKHLVLAVAAAGAALLYARHHQANAANISTDGADPLSGLSRAQPQQLGAALHEVANASAGSATLPGSTAAAPPPPLAAHGAAYDMSVLPSGNSPLAYAPAPTDGSGGWFVQSSGPGSSNAIGTGAVPANWQTYPR